jgi:hypothetical protein
VVWLLVLAVFPLLLVNILPVAFLVQCPWCRYQAPTGAALVVLLLRGSFALFFFGSAGFVLLVFAPRWYFFGVSALC